MELFSGLLLTLVVLAIVGFVARELIMADSGGALGKYLGGSPAADAPMRGKRGAVVDDSGELLRVRIEGERWRANPVAGQVLPAGTPVRVVAAKGLVLVVERNEDQEGSPEAASTEDSEDSAVSAGQEPAP